MVVGNGGIALELLNEIRRIPIVWVIKDSFLGNTFLDAGASAFFLPHLFTKNEPAASRVLNEKRKGEFEHSRIPQNRTSLQKDSQQQFHHSKKRDRNTINRTYPKAHFGASMGPVWRSSLIVPEGSKSKSALTEYSNRDLVIEKESYVSQVWSPEEYVRTCKHPCPTFSGSSPEKQDSKISIDAVSTPTPCLSEYRNRPPVQFVPHLGLFGEGRLGLIPEDELESLGKDLSSPIAFYPTNPEYPREKSPAGYVTSERHIVSEASSCLPETENPSEEKEIDWRIYVKLSSKRVYGVDLVITATGVLPNTDLAVLAGLALAPERPHDKGNSYFPRGILVDKHMHTSHPDIYAAGDCVTCNWSNQSSHWFQMRLWSQARLMGLQVARSMVRDYRLANSIPPSLPVGPPGIPGGPPTPFSPPEQEIEGHPAQFDSLFPPTLSNTNGVGNEERPPDRGGHAVNPSSIALENAIVNGCAPLDVHFELFAHVSRFFGFKVVLLGQFNAQGLSPDRYDVMVRSSHPGEYIKVVKDRITHQLHGAMLIGETDLEELFENLILTGANVSFLEDVVLDPDTELDAPIFDHPQVVEDAEGEDPGSLFDPRLKHTMFSDYSTPTPLFEGESNDTDLFAQNAFENRMIYDHDAFSDEETPQGLF
jgi:hypothetical protein